MKAKLYPVALGLVAGMLWSTGAMADSQYQADRAFCNSSSNQEGKALCMKEAAAAQAERRRGGGSSRGDSSAQETSSSSSSDKGLGEKAREGAQKTRSFTHRQLQKARNFGARHNPSGTVDEPNKAPAALGK